MLIQNLGKAILDRTLVIVLAHPNDESKTKTLNECLSMISFDKLLSCNYLLNEDTQKMCDWILYTKENPILHQEEFPEYNIVLSRWYLNENGEKVNTQHEFDNQYAVCMLIKNALAYAKYLKKDFIHVVNYDFHITDDAFLVNTLDLFDNDLIIYRTPMHSFNTPACSSAFFSGKISTIERFFNQFTDKNSYYNYKHDGYFLEEKLYTYMKKTVTKIKEKDLGMLGKICKIGMHSIIDDFKNEK